MFNKIEETWSLMVAVKRGWKMEWCSMSMSMSIAPFAPTLLYHPSMYLYL